MDPSSLQKLLASTQKGKGPFVSLRRLPLKDSPPPPTFPKEDKQAEVPPGAGPCTLCGTDEGPVTQGALDIDLLVEHFLFLRVDGDGDADLSSLSRNSPYCGSCAGLLRRVRDLQGRMLGLREELASIVTGIKTVFRLRKGPQSQAGTGTEGSISGADADAALSGTDAIEISSGSDTEMDDSDSDDDFDFPDLFFRRNETEMNPGSGCSSGAAPETEGSSSSSREPVTSAPNSSEMETDSYANARDESSMETLECLDLETKPSIMEDELPGGDNLLESGSKSPFAANSDKDTALHLQESESGGDSAANTLNNLNLEAPAPEDTDPTRFLFTHFPCPAPACQAEFPSFQSLETHFQSGHPRFLLPICPFCAKEFPNLPSLFHHTLTAHRFRCNFKGCSKGYGSKYHLDRHYFTTHSRPSMPLTKMLPKGPDASAITSLTWTTASAFVDDNPIYQCQTCDAVFTRQSKLKNHDATVHAPSPSSSSQAAAAPSSQDPEDEEDPDLDFEAVASQDQTNSFLCPVPICNSKESFPSFESLRAHFYTSHPASELNCRHCMRTFPNLLSLTTHVRTSHRWKCVECGRGFKDKSSLKIHVARHSRGTYSKQRFPCPFCTKIFKSAYDVNLHKKQEHAGMLRELELGGGKEELERMPFGGVRKSQSLLPEPEDLFVPVPFPSPSPSPSGSDPSADQTNNDNDSKQKQIRNHIMPQQLTLFKCPHCPLLSFKVEEIAVHCQSEHEYEHESTRISKASISVKEEIEIEPVPSTAHSVAPTATDQLGSSSSISPFQLDLSPYFNTPVKTEPDRKEGNLSSGNIVTTLEVPEESKSSLVCNTDGDNDTPTLILCSDEFPNQRVKF